MYNQSNIPKVTSLLNFKFFEITSNKISIIKPSSCFNHVLFVHPFLTQMCRGLSSEQYVIKCKKLIAFYDVINKLYF